MEDDRQLLSNSLDVVLLLLGPCTDNLYHPVSIFLRCLSGVAARLDFCSLQTMMHFLYTFTERLRGAFSRKSGGVGSLPR